MSFSLDYGLMYPGMCVTAKVKSKAVSQMAFINKTSVCLCVCLRFRELPKVQGHFVSYVFTGGYHRRLG